jgi:hypothetical protein
MGGGEKGFIADRDANSCHLFLNRDDFRRIWTDWLIWNSRPLPQMGKDPQEQRWPW